MRLGSHLPPLQRPWHGDQQQLHPRHGPHAHRVFLGRGRRPSRRGFEQHVGRRQRPDARGQLHQPERQRPQRHPLQQHDHQHRGAAGLRPAAGLPGPAGEDESHLRQDGHRLFRLRDAVGRGQGQRQRSGEWLVARRDRHLGVVAGRPRQPIRAEPVLADHPTGHRPARNPRRLRGTRLQRPVLRRLHGPRAPGRLGPPVHHDADRQDRRTAEVPLRTGRQDRRRLLLHRRLQRPAGRRLAEGPGHHVLQPLDVLHHQERQQRTAGRRPPGCDHGQRQRDPVADQLGHQPAVEHRAGQRPPLQDRQPQQRQGPGTPQRLPHQGRGARPVDLQRRQQPALVLRVVRQRIRHPQLRDRAGFPAVRGGRALPQTRALDVQVGQQSVQPGRQPPGVPFSKYEDCGDLGDRCREGAERGAARLGGRYRRAGRRPLS